MSTTCYSLIESAKTNGLKPSAYIDYVLQRITAPDTVYRLDALLPWNAELLASKKLAEHS